MSYRDYPRALEPSSHERCVALDADGKQCEHKAEFETYYHGFKYMDFPDSYPTWVLVKLCRDHLREWRKLPQK